MKKKLFSAAMALLMAFSFVGCGEEADTSKMNIKASEYQKTLKDNVKVYKKYVKVPDYAGIEVSVDRSSLTITEQDVADYLENILQSFAETEEVKEGVTAVGDTISLDYSGKLNGVAFSGGTATNVTYTVGSGGYIDDLDKGLANLTVGQKYDIPCTFPASYASADLAGKAVVFEVTVHSIMKNKAPELNDAWVVANKEALGAKSNTVAELKKEVREFMEESAQNQFEADKYAEIWEQLESKIEVSGYPKKELDYLKDTWKTNMKTQYENYASYYQSAGINSFDDYLKQAVGLKGDDINAAYEEEATNQAQGYLKEKMVLSIIAIDNNVEITEEDINKLGNDTAVAYGYADYAALLEKVGNEMNSEFGYQLLVEKVQKIINEKAVEKK